MAQIGVQYPDLAQMFGQYSLMPTELGMQRFEGAQQNEQLNRQQALQDILFQEQNDPLKLAQASLQNQGLEAGLPGIFANSSLTQDRAAVSRGSLGEQIAGAKSKGAKEISDNDLAILENSAQKMAMSQDPAEREVGTMLLKQHKDIIRDREKQAATGARNLEQIREQGNQARLTQQQAIDAGKYKKSGAGSGAAGIWDAMSSGKMGFEKGAMALYASAQQAYKDGDTEEGERLMGMANQANEMYIQGRAATAAQGQTGKVDITAMTGGDVPTKAAPTVQPFAPVVPRNIPGPQRTGGVPAADVRADIESGQATFSNPIAEALARQHAGMDNSAFFLDALGGAYSPTKYDYRVGPGGKIQRKPKGN